MSSQGGGFGIPPYFQNNSVSTNYGLNGELPPEIAVKEQALNRRQQIANLLIQKGLQAPQGQMTGRFYVPPSWTQNLANLASIGAGVYGNYKVGQGQEDLAKENQQYTTNAIQQYLSKMAGTPEQPGQPVPSGQEIDTGGMVNAPGGGAAFLNASGAQPVTPADPRAVAIAQRQQGNYMNGAIGAHGVPELPAEKSPNLPWQVGDGANAAMNLQNANATAQSRYPIPIPQPPENPNMKTTYGLGPSTPAQPATPEQKQAAMMELLAKRIPGAQTIIGMQQHQDALKAQQDFQEKEHTATRDAAELEHNRQRDFIHGENQAKIGAELIKANSQIDMNVKLGLMKADMGDQLKRDLAEQAETLKREMASQQERTQRDIAKGHDATQLAIAKMGNQTKETVAGMKGQQKGQMPANALKLQQEALEHIGSMSSINADLKSFEDQIDSGKLKLGPMNNMIGTARNAIGMSDESSRNLASFKATMEKQRNASLLLNKGVQTEGDAQRAWNELFANINDPAVVKQRMQEIQRINERAANLRKMDVDVIRQNYGLDPMDMSGYEKQKAAVGGGGAAKISSDADYEKLPSGATFIAPDGTTRKKP